MGLAPQLHLHGFAAVEPALIAHGAEALLHAFQRNAVVRARRTGERAAHGAQVELDHLGVRARRGVRVVPVALRLRIRLHERHLLLGAAGQAQVLERRVVHGEQRAGAAILRRHVRNARALRGVQAGEARPEALDKRAHHALLAQHLGERQRHVHGRHALGELARQAHAHHLGHERRDGLAERRSLGLDAAHAPAEHADAVRRGRVAVGSHERVEVRHRALVVCPRHSRIIRRHDHVRELLDVQLMADARPWRHDTHVVEALLRPFQEVIALLVARELQLHVLRKRAGAAGRVRDDRVVDHQIAGDLRVDLRRIAAQLGARLAHDCEVHEHRHAREVLEQHARRRELHLAAHLARVACRHDAPGQLLGRLRALGVAQHVLQQHRQRVGKRLRTRNARHRIVGVGCAAHFKRVGKTAGLVSHA